MTADVLTDNLAYILDDIRSFQVDEEIRAGLSYQLASRLLASRKVPKHMQPLAIGVSLRTLQRKRAAKSQLTQGEGATLIETLRVIDRATEVFESRDNAIEWLQAKVMSLGGRRPIDLMDTPIGRRNVERILGRIEHGVY